MVLTWEELLSGGTRVGSGGWRMMLDWPPMVGRFGVGPCVLVAAVGGRMEGCTTGGSVLGGCFAGSSGVTSCWSDTAVSSARGTRIDVKLVSLESM